MADPGDRPDIPAEAVEQINAMLSHELSKIIGWIRSDPTNAELVDGFHAALRTCAEQIAAAPLLADHYRRQGAAEERNRILREFEAFARSWTPGLDSPGEYITSEILRRVRKLRESGESPAAHVGDRP